MRKEYPSNKRTYRDIRVEPVLVEAFPARLG